jgi:hypothetical protein
MGRKSVAQKIIESLEEEQGEADWIVCYDFRDEQPIGRCARARCFCWTKISYRPLDVIISSKPFYELNLF